jgi:hypothetical protein
MHEATQRPVFKYTLQGLEVEEKVYPDDGAKSITREITVKDRGTKAGLYLKLAEGSKIERMPDGSYSVDQRYYIRTASPASVREVNGTKELVAPVEGASVKYTIVW